MRLDVSGVDPTKLDGSAYAEPGTYHWKVQGVNEENDKGHFEVYCEVLAGNPKGQEGRTHRETFYLTPAAIGRLVQFAVALKLATTEGIEKAKANGDEIDIPWDKAEGRQFCAKLHRKKNQDGTMSEYCEFGFQIWALDSKAAKGLPLDTAAAKAFLASGGGKLPEQTAASGAKTSGGNGKSATATAVKTTTATAATTEKPTDDPFGGGDDLFGN